MQLRSVNMKHSTRGFSLVEMLVALLVISIGLLGIAKMQALALSNTNGGRLRAIAAIEAGGLASIIASNHNYWGNLAATLTITIKTSSSSTTGWAITSTDSTLSTSVVCLSGATGSSAPCTAAQMAAYDLQNWATEFQNVMGGVSAANYYASVSCNKLTSGTTQVTCQITVNWAEQNVLANSSQTATGMAAPSYTLLVSP
jgi:type IV pilus assembly protein PilV